MLLYQILIIALSPIILGQIIWLSIRNKQSRYFWQRLGYRYSELPKNSLWFHCASVGEVNTLLPLLKSIHKKNNQLQMIITSNTITGGKIVAQQIAQQITQQIEQQDMNYLYHSYLPFDWRHAVNNFISTVKPVSLNVMETEIWPNLFTACSNKNISIYIINARLSKKTTSANKWIKSLLKNSLENVTKIYARSEENSQAFLQLGAPEKIIDTVGNLKFTTAINSEQLIQQNTADIKRDYVLLASTHDDEELQFFKIWKKLNRSELLIIVPRHPERGPSIARKLDSRQISMRSRNEEITDHTEVFILDTVGELKNYFSKAEVVIMGGSFTPIGGHNILEPAAFNRAIITGPHMENFKEELDLMLANKAIIQVRSFEDLEQQLLKLLNDASCRNDLENNTGKLSQNAETVLEDYSELILKTLL